MTLPTLTHTNFHELIEFEVYQSKISRNIYTDFNAENFTKKEFIDEIMINDLFVILEKKFIKSLIAVIYFMLKN